jgi:hypothetical protein
MSSLLEQLSLLVDLFSPLDLEPCLHQVYLQACRENLDKLRGGKKRLSLLLTKAEISVDGYFTLRAAPPF